MDRKVSSSLTPEMKELVSETRIAFQELLEHLKWHKKYWLRLTVQSSIHDTDLAINQCITDDYVEMLMAMPKEHRTPISFTAAEKHSYMQAVLYGHSSFLKEYCDRNKRYIVFSTRELFIQKHDFKVVQ